MCDRERPPRGISRATARVLAVALEERLHEGTRGAGAHQLVAALLAHEQADGLGEQASCRRRSRR